MASRGPTRQGVVRQQASRTATDLDAVCSLDPARVLSDPKQADTLFRVLREANADDSVHGNATNDPAYWRRLFEVTQAVLKVKGEDALLALEALKAQEEESGERISELETQLSHGRRRGPVRAESLHQNLLQDELSALERRNDNLEQHLRVTELDLSKEKTEKEWFKHEFEQQASKLEQVTRDNQQLLQANQEYQSQLQTYRSSSKSQRGYDAEERERQKLHNVKLSEELDQMRQTLLAGNEQLTRERDSLASELQNGTKDMLEVSEEIARLKAVLNQSDEIVRQLRSEKDQLIAEMAHKEQAYQEKSAAEEAMMATIDKKVDEWKLLLDSRNSELAQCKDELVKQKQALFTAQSDKSQNLQLSQIAQQREEQVSLLEKHVQDQTDEIANLVNQVSRLKHGEGAGDAQQTIAELESTSKQLADQALHDRKLYEQAHADASEKDEQLAAALAKVNGLVQGVYGLPEALKETESLKQQLSIRDREIKELVGRVNKLEDAACSLEDENSELCEKLGIDRSASQVTADLRYGQRVTNEQEKAKARQLAREVERLEEERVELKHQLLVQAMNRGERAVQLGLTTEDLVAVEEFAELLRQAHRRNEPKPTPVQLLSSQQSLKHWKEELQQRDDELERVRTACRMSTSARELLSREKNAVETQLKACEKENSELSVVLKDVSRRVKEAERSSVRESGSKPSPAAGGNTATGSSGSGAGQLMSTRLDELLAVWHSRHSADGNGAVVVQLRSQVEQLVGKTSQLHEQLGQMQASCSSLTMESVRKDMQIETLEGDLATLRQTSAVVARQRSSRLPTEIPLTSAEIISTLNKQLLHSLNRLSEQEETVRSVELALAAAQSQTAAIVHQQEVLYDEYESQKAAWEERERQVKEEKAKLEERHQSDQIRVSRFKDLAESLSSGKGTDDQKAYMVELSQRLAELEITGKCLERQIRLLEDEKSHMQKDHSSLRMDFAAVEKSSKERIGVLQGYRIKAEAQLASLYQQVEDSAPLSDLRIAQDALSEISAKYRTLLSEQSQQDALQSLVNDQKVRLEVYQGQVQELQTKLGLAEEKAHKAEHLLQTNGSSESSSQSSQQSALLEMKVISAEQRVELTQQKLKQALTAQRHLEERNAQLEKHFEELTQLNLEAQQRERNLRTELEGCIPSSEAGGFREQVKTLLESESSLRAEVVKLQGLLDLARRQCSATELRQTVDQLEVTSLRSQLRQLQAGGDEKVLIGKLHRQVVALEVREATALHKLHQAATKVMVLETSLSELQEEANAKTECLYQCKVTAINKQRYLRNTLQVLRRQYSGCVPLAQQEQFCQLLKQTKASKVEAERKLKEAVEKQTSVDDQLAELQLRLGSVHELVNSLKDGTHASKVVQWHGKMEDIRMENFRYLRQLDRLKEEVSTLQTANGQHEHNALLAEESLVSQQQKHEAVALAWECREAELEGTLQRLQLAQERMLRSANELASSGRLIPNPSEPVATQLEQAVRRLKEQAVRCASLEDQYSRLRLEKEELARGKSMMEQQIVRKEKIETELRIRLTGQPNDVPVGEDPVATREKEAVRLAQELITSLKEQLQQKEVSLLKYQSRLLQVQEECASVTDEQKERIALLSQQLQSQKDELFKNLKQAAVKSTEVADPPLPTQKQLTRLQELEDVVAEQDQTVASLMAKIEQAKTDRHHAEDTWARGMKAVKQEMKRQESVSQQQSQQSNAEKENLEKELSALHEQLEVTQAELESAKEAAHHAPSRTMKVLVDKLKQQLATKESQHQALTRALAQLRADMTNMAEQQIKEKMASAGEDMNIQRLIDAHTIKLKTHVDDLQARLTQLTAAADKQNKQQMAFKEKVAELQEASRQKDLSIARQSQALDDRRVEQLKLQGQRDELQQHLSAKQGDVSSKQELTQVRARCRALQTQVEKQNTDLVQLRSTLEQAKAAEAKAERTSRGGSAGANEVQRWEEAKRLQQRCETLQKKLKDREREYDSSAKQTTMLKDTVTRLERERTGLQLRVKRLSVQSGATSDPAMSTAGADDLEKLRQRNSQLEEEVKVLKERPSPSQASSSGSRTPSNRLQAENVDLKKRLVRDGADCEQLRVANGRLEKRVQELLEELRGASQHSKEGSGSGSDAKLQDRVEALQTEVTRKNRMLQEVKRHLKGAADQEQRLQDQCSQLETEVASLRANTPASTQQLVDDLHAARAALNTSETQHAEMRAELALIKRDASAAVANELRSLKAENEKMRAELAAFDPQFFNELEDLKHNYQQALDLNRRYEEQLRMLGRE